MLNDVYAYLGGMILGEAALIFFQGLRIRSEARHAEERHKLVWARVDLIEGWIKDIRHVVRSVPQPKPSPVPPAMSTRAGLRMCSDPDAHPDRSCDYRCLVPLDAEDARVRRNRSAYKMMAWPGDNPEACHSCGEPISLAPHSATGFMHTDRANGATYCLRGEKADDQA